MTEGDGIIIEDAYYQCKCCAERFRDKTAFNEHRNQQLEKLASLRAKIEDVETLAKFLYDELNPFNNWKSVSHSKRETHRELAARLKAHLLEEE